MEPKTIRESIEIYRKRISETGYNQKYAPYDNHKVGMHASPEVARDALLSSGKFQLLEYSRYARGKYQMQSSIHGTLVLVANEVTEGDYPEGWTGLTLHPDKCKDDNSDMICLLNTLEDLLDVAESNKIAMQTEHRDIEYLIKNGSQIVVSYSPD